MTAALAGIGGGTGTLARAQRSALAVLAIRVAGAGLAYGVQVLLARFLGKAEYGIYATVWVLVAILGHGALWGVGQSVYRFVPHHRARCEDDLTRGFLAGGAAFVIASAGGLALLGALALWLGAGWLSGPYVLPLALALLVLPLFALQDYVEGVARAFHWTALAIAPPYLLRPALTIAAMAALVGAGAPADPGTALVAFAVAAGLSLLVQAALVLARLRREFPDGPRRYALREWASASLPIAFVDLTILGLSYVDVLVLSLVLTPEAVGLYFAATRILQFVAFVPYAASAATAGRFAEARAAGEEATLRALVRASARLTALATLVAGLAVLAASPLLFAMFGPDFAGGVALLAILVAGVVGQAAFGPGEDLLTMLGAERLCAVLSLGALALAALLNLVLVPAFGATGAAAAMALAGVARAFALALAARQRLGLSIHVLARSAAP